MHLPTDNFREKENVSRIRKVLVYIQENLSEELSLEGLAGIAFFSPFHFQKIFSHYVGESPKQYIMRLRLERIAHYLKLYPYLSVSDASFQCGFSSPSTFIRAFKKFYGTTPEFWSMNLTREEAPGFPSALDVRVKPVRSLNVAFVESHHGDEDAIPNAFKVLNRWAEPRDLITMKTQYLCVLLDMPFFTEFERCRFRACLTVPDGITVPKEIGLMKIPDGRYASYWYKGSVMSVFRSLVAFRHGWLDPSGYQIAEITGFELYDENPAKMPYESINRQIFIPVKPA